MKQLSKYSFLFILAAIVIFGFKGVKHPPDKKLKLELDLSQVNVMFNALGDCDCPMRQAHQIQNYISEEYKKQFPELLSPVTLTTPPKDSSSKKADSLAKPKK